MHQAAFDSPLNAFASRHIDRKLCADATRKVHKFAKIEIR